MNSMEKNKISPGHVLHRKSERRKIARDIFLVFEEQPRKIRSLGAKKKQLKTKSKFGHLKVQSTNKSRKLLRDIKNESHNKNCLKKSENTKNIEPSKSSVDEQVPRVNPIFLWVKQENTTIVEVRCEDYDKRNRIRITKTTNGWRAVPRTDTTSSRIVNIIKKPIVKVKQELNENPIVIDGKDHIANVETTSIKVKEEKPYGAELLTLHSNLSESKYCNLKEISNINDDAVIKISDQPQCGEFELCPETGLFVYKETKEKEVFNEVHVDQDISLNLDIYNIEDNDNHFKIQNDADCIDDNTKNLKDLLDDPELLQHCSGNVNSGSEIIDSLVKRSCENNLIQEPNLTKEVELEKFPDSTKQNLLQNQEDDSQINNNVFKNPPKSLSFNEVGEIESLNDDMFIDAFKKNMLDKNEILVQEPDFMHNSTSQSLVSKIGFHDSLAKEISNGMNCKKREKMYLSANVINVPKSSHQDAISKIDTSYETINNYILDQFIKINSSNTCNNSVKAHQTEPMDLGLHKEHMFNDTINFKQISKAFDINAVEKSDLSSICMQNFMKQYSNVNRDPDPLTQLQLLIKNPQWKVPDPILIPKERLGAVLASPAREIPLLLTTRPELSLPEAFAFPEIIQNPNILVVSMAQLEAILKNKIEYDEKKKSLEQNLSQQNAYKLNEANRENSPCSYGNANLNKEINRVSMANKIIHTPYLEKLSHDHTESQKSQMCNNYNVFSLCQKEFGLQNKIDRYKNQQSFNHRNIVEYGDQPIELSFLQNIYQSQLQTYFNMNPLAAEAFLREYKTKQSSLDSCRHKNLINPIELNGKKNLVWNTNLIQPNFGTFAKDNRQGNPENFSFNSHCEKIEQTEIPICNSHFDQLSNSQKRISDCTPRLSCRSLSKLLEPKNTLVSNFLVDVSSELKKSNNDFNNEIFKNKIRKDIQPFQPPEISLSCLNNEINSIKPCQSIKRMKHANGFDTSNSLPKNTDFATANGNPALWHPLFGSKSGHSSQWQWTTISAMND